MTDYGLNWTARSIAIQIRPCCSSRTRRWPYWSPEPFGLRSAIAHWLSSMDARQSAEKPLLKGATDIYLCHPPDRTWPEGQIIGGITEGEGRTRAEVRALLAYASHRPT